MFQVLAAAGRGLRPRRVFEDAGDDEAAVRPNGEQEQEDTEERALDPLSSQVLAVESQEGCWD